MADKVQEKVESMKALLGDLKFRRYLKEQGEAGSVGKYGDNWQGRALYKWLQKNPDMEAQIVAFDDGLQKILGERFLEYNQALGSFISYLNSKGKTPDPKTTNIEAYNQYIGKVQNQFSDYLKNNKEVEKYLDENLDKLTEINKSFTGKSGWKPVKPTEPEVGVERRGKFKK